MSQCKCNWIDSPCSALSWSHGNFGILFGERSGGEFWNSVISENSILLGLWFNLRCHTPEIRVYYK